MKNRFLRDIEGHVMTVHQNEGVYRHVEFRNPNDPAYNFSVTTFPYYLCVTGDWGSYVFKNLVKRDMFDEFTREDAEPINLERRVVAEDRQGKTMPFCSHKFEKIVREHFAPLFEKLDEDEREDCEIELEHGLFLDFDNIDQARDALEQFYERNLAEEDYYELMQKLGECNAPSDAFVWNCHAVNHAIAELAKHNKAAVADKNFNLAMEA